MKTLLFILSISILLSCCKDDNEGLIPYQSCQEKVWFKTKSYRDSIYKGNATNYDCPFGVFSTSTDIYSYKYLSVNPNNPYQICFTRNLISSPSSLELMVYDICNEQLTVIANNISYNTSWSVKDWILFTGSDLQLWKVKSNGDSLTKLTNTGSYNNNAVWNTSGTYYYYYDPQASSDIISDENGNILKSFPIITSSYFSNWLNDSTLIGFFRVSGGGVLNTFNINTEVSQTLPSSFIDSATVGFPSVINVKDNNIYLSNDKALVEYDNGISIIDSSYYSYVALDFQSLENDYFILRRIITDTTGLHQCTVSINGYISIFNKNTGEERYLPLE